MPLHDYRCKSCGSEIEISCSVAELGLTRFCRCGNVYERVFLVFPSAFVAADIHYTSPIDDRPITSKQARVEDLKRNGCRPYETGEKEEALTRTNGFQPVRVCRKNRVEPTCLSLGQKGRRFHPVGVTCL